MSAGVAVDTEAYLRKRRDALMMELQEIEKQLGIRRVQVECPSCKERWNKQVRPAPSA